MKVLNNTTEIEESFNCRNRNNCPLDEKFLTPLGQTLFTKHRSCRTNPTPNKKFTLEPPRQISNTDLTTTQNHSTLNTLKTAQSYLKNI